MKIVINDNKRIYEFYDKKILNQLIGEIIIRLGPNNKARLLKLNFIKGQFNNNHWDMVIEDLTKLKYNYFYLLLRENMNYFDEFLNLYKSVGFKTNFKKYPTSVFYKDDEVYRLIHMFY
jgi:hypothetical protein